LWSLGRDFAGRFLVGSRKIKNLESFIECLTPMEKLTEKKVIQIHDFLVEEMGGNPGIRDPATLYFLIEAALHLSKVLALL
jgi:hypothetical protein